MPEKHWICPKCKSKVAGNNIVFKCKRCGYEPPIEDYKIAFYVLKDEFENRKKDFSDAISAIMRESDMKEQELIVFKGITLVLAILCVFLFFK